MAEDVLNQINEIVRLRRQIDEELQPLKSRIDAARIKPMSQFRLALHLRFNLLTMTLVNENLGQQGAVITDIVSWLKSNADRNKTYRAAIASIDKANSKTSLLSEIKVDCEMEISSELPKLRSLVVSLEDFKRAYDELLAKKNRRASREVT